MEERQNKEHEAVTLLKSSLRFGAATGCAGAAIGSVAGILRSSHPALFATLSGIQCFGLGTAYWASRCVVLELWEDRRQSELVASTIAGALSGGLIAALARGRTNVFPGTCMFGLFGFLGQHIYNTWQDYPQALQSFHSLHTIDSGQDRSSGSKANDSLLQRLVNDKRMPVKALSDEDYEGLLAAKLQRIDLQIAVLDDDLAKLRASRGECDRNSSH